MISSHLSLERCRPVFLFLLAVLVGTIAWSGEVLLLPVATVFPALWSLSQSRCQAMAIAAGYFLAASRGLPSGVAEFYGTDLLPGLLFWFAASGSFVSLHGLMWTNLPGWRRAVCYGLTSLALAIPPFGIVGWAHPWTAAGIVFPGQGWLGLLGLAGLLMVMASSFRLYAASLIATFWTLSASTFDPPRDMPRWNGVDLQMGAALGRDRGLAGHMRLIDRVAEYPSGSIVVFPESALGYWTPSVASLWQRGLANSAIFVIAGAATVDASGYDNVLVTVGAHRATVLYRQRMPVPGSMWQPWSRFFGEPGGARSHMFGNPVVTLADKRVAPLICYEQLLIWPILHSAIQNPDLILAVGNGWWTSGTSIVEIQRASVEAWSRLFGLPLVTAFNR